MISGDEIFTMGANEDMSALEAFLALAVTLDRDALNRTVSIADSKLGKQIYELVICKDAAKIDAFKNGIAILKLTAFYLDELHKLFPSAGTKEK